MKRNYLTRCLAIVMCIVMLTGESVSAADVVMKDALSVSGNGIADEIEIFDAGHIFIKIGVVGDISKLFFAGQGIGLDGMTVDEDLTCIEFLDADDSFHCGGLAGTVMADEAVDLSVCDL